MAGSPSAAARCTTVTEEQRATLRHTLGMTRSSASYRNYYCANRGDPLIKELVDAGWMEKYADRDGYEWYRCTPAGIEQASADAVRA